jgi:hypothetical protein
MASNEQEYVWIDIDITLADAIDAARNGEADVVEMLENLKEHLEALRALQGVK